jgi:hypothetical protein
VNLMVYLCSNYHMISLGFPIFRKVQITIDLGGFETHRSGFKSKEMSPPRKLSTVNPLVINQAAAQLTSPRRLPLACEIEEHKQVHREETKSQKEFDSTHEWGSNRRIGVLFLTE